MENMNRKFGWSEKGIIGFIFTPMGAFFLILGILLHYFDVGEGEDSIVFLFVFGGIGLTFLIIGLAFLMADIARRSAMRRVLDSGYYVMAKVVGIQKRYNMNNGAGVQPCAVECHWTNPDTGEVHVFFSRFLYYDPSDILVGKEVPVYMDRMDEKTAFVDIDAIMPKVVLHK